MKERIIQKFKTVVKTIIQVILAKLIPIILICCLVLLSISAFTYFITVDDGTYKEDDWSNTGFAVSEIALSKATLDNIVQGEDGWNIDIDLDSAVDEIIQTLKEKNGVLDKYISNKNVREYLKAFIRAELITQYPDLRNEDKIGTPVKDNEVQGCIQIHRALPETTNGETKILTYIDYDTFNSYVSSGNENATNHFSLDTNGNLVVAGWTRSTTNINSNIPDVENIENQIEYRLMTNSIDYQSLLKKYSMSFDFLWALTVMSEDEEFVYNVAQLALDSKIIITVQDNLTTVTTNIYEQYDIQQKIEKNAAITATVDGVDYSKNVEKINEENPINYYTETNIKEETCRTNIEITYADTWLVEYKNEYSNAIPGEILNEDIAEKDDTEYELKESGTLESDATISSELYNYELELCGGVSNYEIKLVEGNVSGSIGTINYKKYERILNQITTTNVTTSYNTYTNGTPNVIEKTDKNSTEDNFVTLFIEFDKANKNILSAPEWLFEMLEGSPKACDMVDIMKYLLYKATGRDYGVTQYNFSIISFGSANAVRGNALENYIKAWENIELWLYETGQSSSFPSSYLTEDEENYIVYEDGPGSGSSGHNNIAYGIATFISSSTNGTDTHDPYGQGYYNWKSKFAAQGVDVTTLYEGALVNKQITLSVFSEILSGFQNSVEDYLATNLPEYEFTQQQKDSLTAVCYQYGNINGFADAYRNSLNADGTINKESLISKFVVNGMRPFKYTKTVGSRSYANLVLFIEGKYIDSSGNEIVVGASLTDWDGECYSNDNYTFPVYNQYDSKWSNYLFGGPNSRGEKTIASSGCSCCALAMIISGYSGQAITPDILTQKLDEIYPAGNYYNYGDGGNANVYSDAVLQAYGYSKKNISSRAEAIEALKSGYAVIGYEQGHYLAFVPVSSEDAAQGYVFRILDSARGHNVLCREFSDADNAVIGSSGVLAIIYPY